MAIRYKKLVTAAVTVGAMLATVVGCGTNTTNQTGANNTTNGSAANTSTSSSGVLAKVKKSGELTIGTEGTYAPFTYHGANNQLTGFDVDLARAVAQRMGVKANFVETPWDGMLAGLNDKRFDMVANEVGVLPQREKQYLFSTPYIQSASVIIVRDNDNKIHSFKDLKGVKDAQSITSNYAKEAQKYGADITSVQGFNEAIQLIKSGRAEATVNDKLSFLQLKKENPNIGLKIAATSNDAVPSAFAFRKDESDVQQAVNKALNGLIKDGTYEKISDKYFGTNVLK